MENHINFEIITGQERSSLRRQISLSAGYPNFYPIVARPSAFPVFFYIHLAEFEH